ncbi:putative Trans-aconitate 3-methyltransferase [Calycina marina]|uniref:Trans-aconitate 3-methyltransferase n=1 Tax=Calycina marina TaxID=1763456 RepID=A0A9P7YW29_9HELO|nr:putative Trans-aconitate 3-methyltransferase [Calycina marina]
MATFAKATFSTAGYAAFRPSYPPKLFQTVLAYHSGPKSLALDLGCGHGLVSRALAPQFSAVIGTDPSTPMVKQASASSTAPEFKNVVFRVGSAEDLGEFEDGSLDVVVAGQAAHWFNYNKVWLEIAKKVRKGGTLAFWGYKDNYFVEYPRATAVLDDYCYGEGDDKMGKYWEQPGRNILRDLYGDIQPPENEWTDVKRIEYQPNTEGKESGEGEVLMESKMKLGEMEGYVRTFSAYHTWMADHEGVEAKKDGGEGDVVDGMFEKMLEVEPDWRAKGEQWRDIEVENEWGSVILLARKK